MTKSAWDNRPSAASDLSRESFDAYIKELRRQLAAPMAPVPSWPIPVPVDIYDRYGGDGEAMLRDVNDALIELAKDDPP